MNPTWLDLTRPFVHKDAFNPDLPRPTVAVTRTIERDGFRLEELALCSHVGTHMDAPSHVLDAGSAVDAYPLERLSGPAVIVDLRDLEDGVCIDAEVLETRVDSPPRSSVIVLLTGWGQMRGPSARYIDRSPWLDGGGAEWVVAHGAVGVVIDHFSISGRGPSEQVMPAHTTLLGAGVWIVEDALLPDALLDGRGWEVIALPLRLAHASGAPTRVVAVRRP